MSAPDRKRKFEPVPVSNAEALIRAREIMETALPEIAQVLSDAAKAGDVAAGRLVAERMIPVARSAPIRKPVKLSGDAAAQVIQVKDAIASGRISLEEGEALLNAIDIAAEVCRKVADFRRSEEFQRELLEAISAEAPEVQERIMRRLARLKQERGLVISAEAEAVPVQAAEGGGNE